ncbi:MAG: LytR/AlgR family response regulator transcription factor [Vicinamibacterales bacterium]
MRSPIRALVVDDELLARENLRHAIGSVPGWLVTGECESAAAARQFLADRQVDVIFLDIQMGRESGLGLARSLVDRESPPIIVFVTAYEQFAIDAFELHAIDYLLKPFDDARLAQALERVRDLLRLRRQAYVAALRNGLDAVESTPNDSYCRRVTIRSVGHLEVVELADVRWIGAAGNYAELHLPERTLLHRITFGVLVGRLDPTEFMRTHRSVAVRREQCAALSVVGDGVYVLRLRCGDVVPVSERYVHEVRAALVQAQ